MIEMKNETKGTILAILAAVISGIAIPLNKFFIVDLDPTVFTAVRSIIIGVIFLIISLWQAKSSHRKFKTVSWKYLLAIAAIGGAFAFLLFFNGLRLTTAGRGAFLHKTLPLYAAVLAFIFLKEKITKRTVFALLTMFAGMILIYSTQITPSEIWENPQLGDFLVIGAAFLWAIESIIVKKAMNNGETNFVISFARMFFGGIILFGIALLLGKAQEILSLSIGQWINILASTAILFGYVFAWYWAVKKINVSKASSLLLIAPVISLAGGVLLFNEPAPLLQLVGSAFILAGAYFAASARSEALIKI